MNQLKNFKSLRIKNSYGGQQKWLYEYGYLKKYQANHSCAVSVATNYVYYLKDQHALNFPDYQQTELGFTHQMNELYYIMKPRIWGIATLGKFKKRFISYAESLNIELIPFMIKTGRKEIYLNFIQEELKKDYPVLMLTLFSRDKSVSYHWVTITGLISRHKKTELIISNWGRKERLDFDAWYEQAFGKRLISFNLKQDN